MRYTFTCEPDPDDPEFWSIFIDNGAGCSAEVCGKIGSEKVARWVHLSMQALTQEGICHLWGVDKLER